MKYLLYCAFGSQSYKNETVYSLMSLLKMSNLKENGIKVIVLTDDGKTIEKAFKGNESIIIDAIPETVILEWLNGKKYMPRLKIKALEYFFDNYDGNVIFIDTDTFYLKDINPLFDLIDEKNFLMHSQMPSVSEFNNFYSRHVDTEYYKLELPHLKLGMEADETGKISHNGKEYPFSSSFARFNSGVIGIHRSFSYLIKDMLELSDFLFDKTGHWCSEEIAVSYILKNAGNVLQCEPYLFHYIFSKYCRFFLAEVFGYYHENDEEEMNEVLRTFKLDSLKCFNLNYEDLPYMVFFVLSYLQKGGEIDLILFLFEKNSFSISALNDFKAFKRFVFVYEKNKIKPKKEN